MQHNRCCSNKTSQSGPGRKQMPEPAKNKLGPNRDQHETYRQKPTLTMHQFVTMLNATKEDNNELTTGKGRKIECRTRPDQDQKREIYCKKKKIETAKKRLQLLRSNSDQRLHGIDGIITSSSFWFIANNLIRTKHFKPLLQYVKTLQYSLELHLLKENSF